MFLFVILSIVALNFSAKADKLYLGKATVDPYTGIDVCVCPQLVRQGCYCLWKD